MMDSNAVGGHHNRNGSVTSVRDPTIPWEFGNQAVSVADGQAAR